MKKLKGLWRGTLPRFLLLWAVMMGVLGGLSADGQKAKVQNQVEEARDLVEEHCRTVWAGDAEEIKKPEIFTQGLSNELYAWDGVVQFRLYDAAGQELARSQMAWGSASLPETGIYNWLLRLDPVLTREEQLEVARVLREDRELSNFFGSEGGWVDSEITDARWCDVVGAVDWEREVIYPKTVTYVYADRELTLVDSGSGFFDGKELTSFRFNSVRIYSALVGLNASPREMLRRWQEAEAELDSLLNGYTPGLNTVAFSSDGSQCVPLDGEVILASAYSYSPLRQVAAQQWPTALLTLLAAAALARWTDKKQRATIERERDFTRAAAHELKTPLAVLRTHAEALREDIDPGKREQYLDVILEESDRMGELVGGLLELSRLESKAALNRENVELSQLVRQVWEHLSLQLEQKGISLDLELEEVELEGDRERLKQAVGNLASNALRHCPPGGTIQVDLARKGDRACLSVYNDGPLIPQEDLPHLFEPFYRGDRSRSRDSGGTGLGLVIVQAAALAHGGSCWVRNEGSGPCFQLLLPLDGGMGPAEKAPRADFDQRP